MGSGVYPVTAMRRRGASVHLRLTSLVAAVCALLLACSAPAPVAPTLAPAPTASPVTTPRPTPTFRPAVPPTMLAPPPTSVPDPDSDTPQIPDSQVVQALVASSIGIPMQQVSMGFLTSNPSSARVQMLFDSS